MLKIVAATMCESALLSALQMNIQTIQKFYLHAAAALLLRGQLWKML